MQVVAQIQHWDSFLQGPDGPDILRAVHLLWQDKAEAMRGTPAPLPPSPPTLISPAPATAGSSTCGFHDVADTGRFYYRGGELLPRGGSTHSGRVGAALQRSWQLLSGPAVAGNMSDVAPGGRNSMSRRLAAYVLRILTHCGDVERVAKASSGGPE